MLSKDGILLSSSLALFTWSKSKETVLILIWVNLEWMKSVYLPAMNLSVSHQGQKLCPFSGFSQKNTISLLPCMGKFAILMISYFLSVQKQNTTSVNMTDKSKIATKYHLKIWSWLEFSRRVEVDLCPLLIFYTALHRLMKTTEQQESNKRRRVGKLPT